MAVALVQENDGNVGATRQTSVTVATVNNLAAGSVVTVEITANNVPTITPSPGTWTSIMRQISGTSHVVEAFWHAVTAGEVGTKGNWVFSVGATTRSICWHGWEWSGADTLSQPDGTPTGVIAASTSIAVPTITVAAGAAVVLATAYSAGSGAFITVTPPDGTWTEVVDQHTAISPAATDSSEEVCYKLFAAGGATGTMTLTGSGSGATGIGYGVKAAAAAASPTGRFRWPSARPSFRR